MRGLKASLLLAGTGAAALAIAMTAAQPQPANNSVFTADQATIGADRLSDHLRALPSARPPRQHGRPAFGRNQFLQRLARPFHDRPLQQDHHLDARRQSGIAPGAGGHQHRRVHPAPERCGARHAGLRRDNGGPDRPGRNRRCAARAASRGCSTCRLKRAPARIPAALNLEGNIQNYVPVTDEMLKNPARRRLADGARRLSRLEPQRGSIRSPRTISAVCVSPGCGR